MAFAEAVFSILILHVRRIKCKTLHGQSFTTSIKTISYRNKSPGWYARTRKLPQGCCTFATMKPNCNIELCGFRSVLMSTWFVVANCKSASAFANSHICILSYQLTSIRTDFHVTYYQIMMVIVNHACVGNLTRLITIFA